MCRTWTSPWISWWHRSGLISAQPSQQHHGAATRGDSGPKYVLDLSHKSSPVSWVIKSRITLYRFLSFIWWSRGPSKWGSQTIWIFPSIPFLDPKCESTLWQTPLRSYESVTVQEEGKEWQGRGNQWVRKAVYFLKEKGFFLLKCLMQLEYVRFKSTSVEWVSWFLKSQTPHKCTLYAYYTL